MFPDVDFSKERSANGQSATEDQIFTPLSGLYSHFDEYFLGVENESPDTKWI